MALNGQIDISKLKALPRRLQVLAVVVVVDLLAIIVAIAIFGDELDQRQAHVDQLHAQLTQLRRQQADFRHQIEQYPEHLARYNAEVQKGILTAPDPRKLVADVQDYASHRHLSDLHWKLQAEDNKAEPKARLRLDTTLVNVESNALLDTDALAFWDEMLRGLPSHYQVVDASLERMREVDAKALGEIRAGRSISLVNVKIAFRWSALRPAAQEAP